MQLWTSVTKWKIVLMGVYIDRYKLCSVHVCSNFDILFFIHRIVQSNDSITIQPVSLEQVHLRDVSPTEGLGIFIKATFEGHHVVTGTRKGSVASRARKIFSGDEVVAVNGTVVVCCACFVLWYCWNCFLRSKWHDRLVVK